MLSALTFLLRGPGFIFMWASLTPSLAKLIDVDAEENAVTAKSVEDSLIAHTLSDRKIGATIPAGFSKYHMAKDAALIAKAVYKIKERSVPGWTLKDAIEGSDQVGLYQRGSTCVVGFAGSNDWRDWIDNFNISTIHKCGLDFHGGFYNALLATVQKPKWSSLVNTLVGPTCGEVVLTGHSQGGAMASILAACANQNGGLKTNFPSFPAFTVDMLYTIGAPGVVKQRIRNDQQTDGCFAGLRTVNYDSKSYDPVPYVTSKFGFVHLPLDVIRFKMTWSWWGKRSLSKETFSCNSKEAFVYPYSVSWWFMPDIRMHGDYVSRFEKLLRR